MVSYGHECDHAASQCCTDVPHLHCGCAGGGNGCGVTLYGGAVDNVESLRVVLPQESGVQVVEVDQESDPQLFAGLKGAGEGASGDPTCREGAMRAAAPRYLHKQRLAPVSSPGFTQYVTPPGRRGDLT
jgi:hypothetical protein